MRISDKKLFEALMAGKAVRRAGWESMPHRPYFIIEHKERFDKEWLKYKGEL